MSRAKRGGYLVLKQLDLVADGRRGDEEFVGGEGVPGLRVAEIGGAFGMVAMFAAHKGVSGLGPLYTPWEEVFDVITLQPSDPSDAPHDRPARIPPDDQQALADQPIRNIKDFVAGTPGNLLSGDF